MTENLPPLSFYSKRFWLELTMRTYDDWANITIWDLTTNPIWDEHRTSEVVGINGIILDDLKIFPETYPLILTQTHNRLTLILAGWTQIELQKLSILQRFKDTMKWSALLPFVAKYPDGYPLPLTDDTLRVLWIRRGVVYDKNGYRQWFWKYTKEHLGSTFFNK